MALLVFCKAGQGLTAHPGTQCQMPGSWDYGCLLGYTDGGHHSIRCHVTAATPLTVGTDDFSRGQELVESGLYDQMEPL